MGICTTRELISLHLIMGVRRIHSSVHVKIFIRWVPHQRYDGKRCPSVQLFVRGKISPLSENSHLQYSLTLGLQILMEWKDLARRDPRILHISILIDKFCTGHTCSILCSSLASFPAIICSPYYFAVMQSYLCS